PVEACPPRVRFRGQAYRRRGKTANTLGTVFGPVAIRRCVYECLEPGEPCCWPLELRLGVVAGLATPALAERAGRWPADHGRPAREAVGDRVPRSDARTRTTAPDGTDDRRADGRADDLARAGPALPAAGVLERRRPPSATVLPPGTRPTGRPVATEPVLAVAV